MATVMVKNEEPFIGEILICKKCGFVHSGLYCSDGCRNCGYEEFWIVSSVYHQFPKDETFLKTWRP